MAYTVVAYLLLIVLGPTGLHLCYLNRPKHGFVWASTGGFFLVGLLRDMVMIPRYVRECNGADEELSRTKLEMEKYTEPPLRYGRSIGALIFGAYLGYLFSCADQIGDHFSIDESILSIVLESLGVSVGVWIVISIGNENCSFWKVLFATACMTTLLRFQEEPNGRIDVWMESAAATFMSSKTKFWRPLPLKKKSKSRFSFVKSAMKMYAFVFMFLFLVSYGDYNHGEMSSDDDSGYVPIKFLVDSFFDKDEWRNLSETLNQLFQQGRREGWYKIYEELRKSTNVFAEAEAFKVLELEDGATKEQIRKQYRKLSKIYHPDRNPDSPPDRFEKIVQAYEFLTNKKNN